MLPLILLVLTDPLGLSFAQIGLVSTLFTLASSLSQPFFGWIGDRQSNRLLAVLGVAAIATTIGVMRFADQFTLLLILSPIAGLGSGAFHPQGAALAAHTPPQQRGSAMSIFMLGGNSGYAFGPIFATAAFALTGRYMPEMLALLGLGQAALVYWAIAVQQRAPVESHSAPAATSATHAATSVIITLTLVIFLRSWVHGTVTTFVPQVYKAQGFSIGFASNVLFSILMPLAIGGLIGGTLSDRIGGRRVLIASTALIGPALWGLLHAAGIASFIWGPLLGIAIGASLPVTLVMAQGLIPRGLGLMSGLVLGFTFIASAIGVSINGVIADQVGLLPTMAFNALLPLAAAGLAFLLPDDRPGAQAVGTDKGTEIWEEIIER
jgi:FSR family fosmidomycin resistance protein-like MFS transporter